MVDKNIAQHFRPDEGPFIDQMESLINMAQNQYRPILTGFLNPRQVYIVTTLVNRIDGIWMKVWGGYKGAEMQRVLFYPDYYQPLKSDFDIQLFQINYPQKFEELHHRQILGSLMGSGIKREAVGDIITNGADWQFFASQSLCEYIKQQVTKMGRVHIKLIPLSNDQVVTPQNDWEQLMITVSSMRLDTVISSAFNYSRNRSKTLIERGLVRVNWEELDRVDYQLDAHDLISVRHGGRIKVDFLLGKNKKGNQKVKISIVYA